MTDADARDAARAAIGIAPKGSLVLIVPPAPDPEGEGNDPTPGGGTIGNLQRREVEPPRV